MPARIGIDVPWIASWSDELLQEDVRPCPHAGGDLAMWLPDLPGSGKPLFKVLHPVRHRAAIAELRCMVCGETTPSSDRWLIPFGFWCTINGMSMFAVEPPMHGNCLDHALEHCPDLRSRGWKKFRLRVPFRRHRDRTMFKKTIPCDGAHRFLLTEVDARKTFGAGFRPRGDEIRLYGGHRERAKAAKVFNLAGHQRAAFGAMPRRFGQ